MSFSIFGVGNSPGPIDLSGLTGIEWTPQWAEPPVTSAVVNVPADMTLADAVQESDTLVLVDADTYNVNLQVTGSNLDIVFTGSTLNGYLRLQTANQHHVRWTGGSVVANVIDGFAINAPNSDLMFNNLNFYGRARIRGDAGGGDHVRNSFANCTFNGDPDPLGVDGMLLATNTGSNSQNIDTIYANCKFECDDFTSNFTDRFHCILRGLWYNCAFGIDSGKSYTPPGTRPSGFRIGSSQGDPITNFVHLEDCLIGERIFMSLTEENPPGTPIDVQQATNMRFVNCTRWDITGSGGEVWATQNQHNTSSTGVVNGCGVVSDTNIGAAFSFGHPGFSTETSNSNVADIALNPLPNVDSYGADH